MGWGSPLWLEVASSSSHGTILRWLSWATPDGATALEAVGENEASSSPVALPTVGW